MCCCSSGIVVEYYYFVVDGRLSFTASYNTQQLYVVDITVVVYLSPSLPPFLHDQLISPALLIIIPFTSLFSASYLMLLEQSNFLCF